MSPPNASPLRPRLVTLQHQHINRHNKTSLLVIECTINNINGTALVDPGAEATFIHKRHAVNLKSTNQGILIQVADGRKIVGRGYSNINFSLKPQNGQHYMEKSTAVSAPIAYDFILGKDWLDYVGAIINCPTNTIYFNNQQ
jgi:hypothetical protein